ncbi:unnamed protein product [Hydatigera taeniaeformis]|uniref:Fibronectin type III domain-containing protein n=1 Tax=Hydatigena taeniaeformis TaxID=6205 RepID=A0A0R3XCL6_HYDTA|nr:unnamed protein product [Hydatigera taeniaeformis]
MKTVKDGFVTALPQHYRWIRVGSSSVDLGWDVDALRGLRANEMNLTAYYYTNSINYVHRAVTFSRGKLTLDRLRPSTFYEMLIQPMKNGILIRTHTANLKTLAEGELVNAHVVRKQTISSLFIVFEHTGVIRVAA